MKKTKWFTVSETATFCHKTKKAIQRDIRLCRLGAARDWDIKHKRHIYSIREDWLKKYLQKEESEL